MENGIRRTLSTLKRRWYFVVLSLIIFLFLFGWLALLSIEDSKKESESASQKTKKYEKTLAEYDAAINETQESIKNTETMVEETKVYCENAVYMQLDSQKVYFSEVQYSIQHTENSSNIIKAMQSYIEGGGLQSDLVADSIPFQLEYFQDLISCTVNNNTMNVFFVGSEKEMTSTVMDQNIIPAIAEYWNIIKTNFGEFDWYVENRSDYVKADTNVLNTQNSNLNNLRNYQAILSDYHKKLTDQFTAKEYYISLYEPEELPIISPKRNMLNHILAGIAIGLLVPVFICLLFCISDDRVKKANDLQSFGLPLLGTGTISEENNAKLLSALAKNEGKDCIFISILSETLSSKEKVNLYKEALEMSGIHVFQGHNVWTDANALRELTAVGACVILTELGETTFTQIKNEIAVCGRLNVKIWGIIV